MEGFAGFGSGFTSSQLISIEKVIAPTNPLGYQGPGSNTISAGSATSANIDLSAGLAVFNLQSGNSVTYQVQNFKTVIGSANADSIKGNSQDNFLIGASGNDTFIASAGNDILRGDDGADIYDYSNLGQVITFGVTFGSSLDSSYVGLPSLQKGNAGADVFLAGSFSASDTLIAPAGQANTLDWSGVTSAETTVTVNLKTGLVQAFNFEASFGYPKGTLEQVFRNFVNVVGTSNADSITGNGANNTLKGLGGNDLVTGGGGADTLTGGLGDDTLVGGDGKDLLLGTDATARGANERDKIMGKSGSDRFILGDQSGAYYQSAGDDDFAQIQGFAKGDTLQLSAGQYLVRAVQSGFNLYSLGSSSKELIAKVKIDDGFNNLDGLFDQASNYTFNIESGQKKSNIFVGA